MAKPEISPEEIDREELEEKVSFKPRMENTMRLVDRGTGSEYEDKGDQCGTYAAWREWGTLFHN